jgi:hypothetical protein
MHVKPCDVYVNPAILPYQGSLCGGLHLDPFTLKLPEKGCQVEQLHFEDPHYKYNIIEEDGNHWCEVRLMLLAYSMRALARVRPAVFTGHVMGIQLLALRRRIRTK